MEDARPGSNQQLDLRQIVRKVRRYWRLKLALRGIAIVTAIGAVMLLVAAYGLEWARFSSLSIIISRIGLAVIFTATLIYFLVRPLIHKVTDEQVALYLEEHEPALEAAIISAVEVSQSTGTSKEKQPLLRSPVLVGRLISSAIERCLATGAGRRVEIQSLVRYTALAVAVWFLGLAIFLAGPVYLRQALSAMLLMSQGVEAAVPYRIEVTPGHATLPRGADQTISAKLLGFDVTEGSLMVRRAEAEPFEEFPLIKGEDGLLRGMLFKIEADTNYFVEAKGVRSSLFNLEIVDLPYVQQLHLQYRFPAYTRLDPKSIEYGGDIAVVTGTQVSVAITPTMQSPGGRIVLNDQISVPLALESDGTLTSEFTVQEDGFYRIELDTITGTRVTASPQYIVDALSDRLPLVAFTKPGRDVIASPIEEVFLEATATDDYGLSNLELVYSVNGGKEQRVQLYGGRARLDEISAGHNLYFEELDVQPGDTLSYYARVLDNNTVSDGSRQATSDLYFVRVRPFDKDFQKATSMGGSGMNSGDMADSVGGLSEQQRQIISATFNVQRDQATYTPETLRQHVVLVGLSQSRLREKVEGLVARMNSRLIARDTAFNTVGTLLPKAVVEMEAAELNLRKVLPGDALSPEHRALQYLQQAEEEYKLQIGMNNANGGTGMRSQMAEELAELFELEFDKITSQYEVANRAIQQDTNQRFDELLEQLKDLARRQEQEVERQRRRSSLGQGRVGGGVPQRSLADQAEEAARRLERLSREEKHPDLMESVNQLRNVAASMRSAAAHGDEADVSSAVEQLRNAENQLREFRANRTQQNVREAQRQVAELLEEQAQIRQGAKDVTEYAGLSRQQLVLDLNERKQQLRSQLDSLDRNLNQSASAASREDRQTAHLLSEAANAIRDQRLQDKIRYSQRMLGRTLSNSQDRIEKDIFNGLNVVLQRVDKAAEALGRAPLETESQALRRARRIARGLESLEQRTLEQVERRTGQNTAQGSQSNADAGSQTSNSGVAGSPGNVGTRGHLGSLIDQSLNSAFTPDDIRQFREEISQWSREVQALRQDLVDENLDIDLKDLDAILRVLGQLEDEQVSKTVAELERFQTFVTEHIKRFEYLLRRQVNENNAEVLLSGVDEVPESFRAMVEQYYRSLSSNSQ